MYRMFLSLLILTFQAFAGDVEDYFKKVGNKANSHTMRNIDFIYTINLDERPEKFEQCIRQLEPYGIHPFRFSAVNGWELSLKAIDELGIKYAPWMKDGHWGTCYLPESDFKPYHEIVQVIGRTYFCHCMPLGSIGIVLSHLSVLQDAYDSGYETIWVMEDDIEIIRNPQILPEVIDKLDSLVGKKGWDILFTDQDTKDQKGNYVPCSSFAWRPNFTPPNPGRFAEKHDISPDFRRIGARYGAYSMIIRRSGMKKLLDFIKAYQIFLPYDMEYTLPPSIRLFTVTEDIVSTQPRAISDNGAPNYKNRLVGE